MTSRLSGDKKRLSERSKALAGQSSTHQRPRRPIRVAVCVMALASTASLSCSPPQPTVHIASAGTTRKRTSHADPAIAGPLELFFNLENLEVPREKVLRGEMAKDDIKSLVNPPSIPSEEATDIGPHSRVVGTTVNGESRAYPLDVLTWHEVVNDRVGGVDLAVTYCVLCDSVGVVARRLDGKTYEFGVSGLIYESNMLLYDRSDRALWSQMSLSAISGPNAGRSLENLVDWELTTWEAWRSAHPKSRVVAPGCTGFNLPYHSDKYVKYFQTEALDRRFQDVVADGRLPNKTVVIGVRNGSVIRAYPIKTLMKNGRKVIQDKVGSGLVEFSVDPAAHAIRIMRIPENAQVISTFWFAWAARFPNTELYSTSTP